MAQVPFTGLSGEAAAGTIGVGVPDAYQRISADPNAFGANVGQAAQRLGGTLEQAGGTALGIATEQQQRYNQTTIGNAFQQLRDRATSTSWGNPQDPNAAPGLLTTSGDQALRAYQPAVDGLKKAQSDIAATLSPEAARVFNLQAQRFLGDTFNSYDQHRAVAQKQWEVSSLDAQAQSAQSAAIAGSGDQNTFLHGLADARNAIITKGSTLGWSPEVISQQLADTTSKTYVGATERLAATNPQAAWGYYQANQKNLTGQDQLAIEGRLRPALMQWGARDDANNLLAMHGAAANAPLAPAIIQAAQQQGVGASLALTTAAIESDVGRAPDRPGADPQGPFQMTSATWAARGGTAQNRSDPAAQVQLGVSNLVHSQQVAGQAIGQAPADWQTYLVHQQGDAGGPALLKADPSQPAVAALAPAYGGNVATARQAITANGGSADMTAGQFLATWRDKYAAKAAAVMAPGSGPNAVRPDVPAMMDAASHMLDPFGQANPQYQDAVQSRLRAKMNEMEYAEREAQKSNRETLLGAAMGLPASNAAPAGTAAPISLAAAVPGADPSASAPGIATPPAPVPGQIVAAPARPTSIDQLLQNPAAKAAWTTSTPETQRSIMQLIEHNSRGEDPPLNAASQGLYYQLSGMATNDREAFQKLDLSDPQYTSALPHSYWNSLAGEQRRFGNADVAASARDATQTRALSVLKPDLLAAGIKTDGLKPGSTAAKDYDTFVGRLRESLEQFHETNNRRPNDGEVAKIGQTLLMQGTQRGTAGIFPWSSDKAVRGFQVDPGQFAPAVPPPDRTGIVAAYTQRFGQPPTDGQIAEAFMRSRAQATAKQPSRRPVNAPSPAAPSMAPTAPSSAPAMPMAQAATLSDAATQ